MRVEWWGTVRGGFEMPCVERGSRDIGASSSSPGDLGFLKLEFESFTQAHDDDDIPGSLGASTATHLQMLGRDRTPARPQTRARKTGERHVQFARFVCT